MQCYLVHIIAYCQMGTSDITLRLFPRSRLQGNGSELLQSLLQIHKFSGSGRLLCQRLHCAIESLAELLISLEVHRSNAVKQQPDKCKMPSGNDEGTRAVVMQNNIRDGNATQGAETRRAVTKLQLQQLATRTILTTANNYETQRHSEKGEIQGIISNSNHRWCLFQTLNNQQHFPKPSSNSTCHEPSSSLPSSPKS